LRQSQSNWILVKGSGGGGLGDRLRALCVAIAYARATGRGVSVDWRDGRLGAEGVNRFSELFEIKDIPYVEPEWLEGISDPWPPSWRGRLQRSLHEVYVEDGDPVWDRVSTIARYSFDPTDDTLEHSVVVLWDFDRLSALARLPRFNAQGLTQRQFEVDIVTRHLQPVAAIEQRVAKLLARSEGSQCRVGAHVRATLEAKAQKGEVPLRAYFSVLDRLLGQRECRLFLATDNMSVQQAFQQRYGDVMSLPKWFGAPGDSLHLNPECPDIAQAAEDAVVEMIALARSDHLVLRSNSSFSIMAGLFFSGDPRRITYVDARPSFPSRLRGAARRLLGPAC